MDVLPSFLKCMCTPCNRDMTDKATEFFSEQLMAPEHECGGIFARSVHLKLPEKGLHNLYLQCTNKMHPGSLR